MHCVSGRMRSVPNCELSPSIRTTHWQRYFCSALGSTRRAMSTRPGGAGGPRGATGAGDISAVIGWPVYLDVIERRFTDALQAVEKRVVNDDRAHLQQLAGRVAIRVLAGEP